MKKQLDELNEIEKELVAKFINAPAPGMGIDSVVFTAENSYVVFT